MEIQYPAIIMILIMILIMIMFDGVPGSSDVFAGKSRIFTKRPKPEWRRAG